MNIFDKTTDRERFRQTMASLNTWQKIEYLFQYYGWVLIFVGLAVALCFGVAQMIENSNTRTVYCGTVANVNLTNEGWEYLTTDYLELLGYTEEDNCIVDSFPTKVDDPANKSFFLFSYAAEISASSVNDMVRNQDLDYLIGDQYSTLYYLAHGWPADLNDVLSQAQMEALADRIFSVTNAEGKTYPAAIEITDWAFVQDCCKDYSGSVYIIFPGNTDRPELTVQFIDYLLAYPQ